MKKVLTTTVKGSNEKLFFVAKDDEGKKVLQSVESGKTFPLPKRFNSKSK